MVGTVESDRESRRLWKLRQRKQQRARAVCNPPDPHRQRETLFVGLTLGGDVVLLRLGNVLCGVQQFLMLGICDPKQAKILKNLVDEGWICWHSDTGPPQCRVAAVMEK